MICGAALGASSPGVSKLAYSIGVLLDASADVWVTVRATADPKACSVDLKAPILVHEGHAHQVINEAPGLAVRTPLLPEGPAAPGA